MKESSRKIIIDEEVVQSFFDDFASDISFSSKHIIFSPRIVKSTIVPSFMKLVHLILTSTIT